ncbi:hypothetical protein L596_014309 [Steinernema carpocapsae]|uniref:Uncharacterized protein n=1 Tax=Steinernema carpocapsae TaxID=34508 RepID=A0A4U5NBI2_STECR|nr:hypothetical protein L596_014309 [Steinernema carpocapsae]
MNNTRIRLIEYYSNAPAIRYSPLDVRRSSLRVPLRAGLFVRPRSRTVYRRGYALVTLSFAFTTPKPRLRRVITTPNIPRPLIPAAAECRLIKVVFPGLDGQIQCAWRR